MLTNRGRYLALFNQHERAILAFKEALALDPISARRNKGWQGARRKSPSHSSAELVCSRSIIFLTRKDNRYVPCPAARLSG